MSHQNGRRQRVYALLQGVCGPGMADGVQRPALRETARQPVGQFASSFLTQQHGRFLEELAFELPRGGKGRDELLDGLIRYRETAFQHELFANANLNPHEHVVDSVCGPRRPATVAEQLALRAGQYESPSDLGGCVSQVNHSQELLVLAFRFGKDPTLFDQINMTGLDPERLLRSAAGLPCRDNHVAKTWVADQRQQLLVLLRFRSPSLLSQRVPNAHESPCFQGLSFLPCLEEALLKRRFRVLVGGFVGGNAGRCFGKVRSRVRANRSPTQTSSRTKTGRIVRPVTRHEDGFSSRQKFAREPAVFPALSAVQGM